LAEAGLKPVDEVKPVEANKDVKPAENSKEGGADEKKKKKKKKPTETAEVKAEVKAPTEEVKASEAKPHEHIDVEKAVQEAMKKKNEKSGSTFKTQVKFGTSKTRNLR